MRDEAGGLGPAGRAGVLHVTVLDAVEVGEEQRHLEGQQAGQCVRVRRRGGVGVEEGAEVVGHVRGFAE